MRTNERTFKQHLAFDDKDRNSDLHNDACLYLAQDEKARKLLGLLGANLASKIFRDWGSKSVDGLTDETVTYTPGPLSIVSATSALSEPIKSSYGVAGFADLVVRLEVGREYRRIDRKRDRPPIFETIASRRRMEELRANLEKREPCEITGSDEPPAPPPWVVTLDMTAVAAHDVEFVVEVKAGVTHVTSVVQQLEMYKTFRPPNLRANDDKVRCYVLATLYPISQTEKETLARHEIAHIYVSPEHVKAFVASQKKSEDLAF